MSGSTGFLPKEVVRKPVTPYKREGGAGVSELLQARQARSAEKEKQSLEKQASEAKVAKKRKILYVRPKSSDNGALFADVRKVEMCDILIKVLVLIGIR